MHENADDDNGKNIAAFLIRLAQAATRLDQYQETSF